MRYLMHCLAMSLICLPAFTDEAAIHLIHATTPPRVNVLATSRIASAAVAANMTIDGKFDEPAWQAASPIRDFMRFGSPSLAAVKTSVKFTYDADAIYVAFECAEPAMASLKTPVNLPRDDDGVWQNDSVELFVDPAGNGEIITHLIISAGGGIYDERLDRSSSAVSMDATWNGQWQSAVARGEQGWTAEVRMPLASLGIAKPLKSGDRFDMQIARSRHVGESEIHTWTLTPDRKLANRANFGSLILNGAGVVPTSAMIQAPGLGANELRVAMQNHGTTRYDARGAMSLLLGDKVVQTSEADLVIPAGGQADAVLPFELTRLGGDIRASFTLTDRATGSVLTRAAFSPGIPDRTVTMKYDGHRLAVTASIGHSDLKRNAWAGIVTVLNDQRQTVGRLEHKLTDTSIVYEVALPPALGKVWTIRFDATRAGESKPTVSESLEYVAILPAFVREPKHDIVPRAAAAVERGRVPIVVNIPPDVLKHVTTLPVQCGVPLPMGALRDPAMVRLLDPAGKAVALTSRPLAWWSPPGSPNDENRSVKWLLIAFDADLREQGEYTLEFGTAVKPAQVKPGIRVTSDAAGHVIHNGVMKVTLPRRAGALLSAVALDGHAIVAGGDQPNGPYMIDQNGEAYLAALDQDATFEVEEQSDAHVVMKAQGRYFNGKGEPINQWIVRLRADAGHQHLRLFHTFVFSESFDNRQYRQIGLELPLAFGASDATVTFPRGTAYQVSASLPEPVQREDFIRVKGSDASSVMLHQSSHNAWSLYKDDVKAESGARNGHWIDVSRGAGGVGARGGVTAAMRWAWQQHPNGFEWIRRGDKSALRMHLWTMRDERNLDVRPRPWLEAKGVWDYWTRQIVPVKRVHEYPPELGGTMVADGAGMSKTHELLLVFHGNDDLDAASEAAHALQKPAYAFARPDWTADTLALGRFHPRDRERFGDVEKAVDMLMDRFLIDQADDKGGNPEYGDSYGIFDFGDTLHANKYAHRYWTHMFYVEPMSWWTQFARTGDRRFLEFGEASSRHHMDVDTCHWDVSEKIPRGSFNQDDAGMIHWALYAPHRVTTSNYLPYLTRYHYLTGNQRAADVARMIGDMMKAQYARHGLPTWHHRGTAQPWWAAIELYQLTWDPIFKEMAQGFAEQTLANTREGLSTGYGGDAPVDFTLAYLLPAAIAHHQLTGDERIAQWIVNQAAYLARWKRGDLQHSYFNVTDGIAYAYFLTGDAKLLGVAKARLDDFLTENPTPASFDAFIGNRVWWMQKIGELAAALNHAGGGDPSRVAGDSVVDSTAGEILLLDEKDDAFQVDIILKRIGGDDATMLAQIGDISREAAAGGPWLVLTAPDGKVIERRPYPSAPKVDTWYHNGGWCESFILRPDGRKGIYRVRMEAAQGIHFQLTLVNNTLGKAMFQGASGDGISPGFRFPKSNPYWFWVPADAEKMTFSYLLVRHNHDFKVRITDPDGKTVVDRNLGRETERPRDGKTWLEIPVEVPTAARGKFWRIEPGSYYETRFWKLQGAPPYFAVSEQSAFVPVE